MSEDGEELLAELKAARGGAAELKLLLMAVRAELPTTPIFAFEGDDDRGVYFSWVRFLDAEFRYEPFSCRGKDGVLKLKGALDRDVGGLGKGVYFFIDRDFDDSRGVAIDDSIYMTDRYSIENYLVCEDVLEEVLKIEYHCQAQPAVRTAVKTEFNRLYQKFLSETVDINRELHAARRLKIELGSPLPKSAGKFVTVSLSDVIRTATPSADVIKPKRAITADEFEGLRAEFENLVPIERYRGKFALLFMLKWLEELAKDRSSATSQLFVGLDCNVKVNFGRLSVVTLASRSVPPQAFRDFFEKVSGAA
jgi:hypothetical protein